MFLRAAQLEQENIVLLNTLKSANVPLPVGLKKTASSEALQNLTRQTQPSDYAMLNAIQMSAANFVVSDATNPEYPIIFASPGFLEMTGYSRDEVIGRNCRFLQGEHTDRDAVAEIRRALDEKRDVGVTFLNYKKDKTPFWNQLFIAPLADANNVVRFHVGVQRMVTINDGAIAGNGVTTGGSRKKRRGDGDDDEDIDDDEEENSDDDYDSE